MKHLNLSKINEKGGEWNVNNHFFFFLVTVLSKPSKPLGPLVVSDVTKNSAHLDFSKPLDDGGSPIDRMFSYYGNQIGLFSKK